MYAMKSIAISISAASGSMYGHGFFLAYVLEGL